MKFAGYVFSLAASLALVSCHGFQDPNDFLIPEPEAPYTLSVSKSVIESDGNDAAVLEITDVNGMVLTDDENIRNTSFYIEELDEWRSGIGGAGAPNVFTSIMDGTYTITAMYKGVPCANSVTVTSQNRSKYEVFHKNVAIYRLTGTWCQYCPYMTEALSKVDSYTRDHSIVMEFHNNDEFSIPYNGSMDMAAMLLSRYGTSNDGYPYAIYSLGEGSGKRTVNDIQRFVKNRMVADPARTGIKAESVVENGKVSVKATVMASVAGKYDLGIAVLKDNCRPTSSTANEDVYNNVVLMISGNLYAMSSDAFDLESGEEVQIDKVCEHADILPGAACRVVLFTLADSAGKTVIDNAVSFKIGESVDYRYNTDSVPELPGDDEPSGNYPQKMLGMQFTSIGCTNCPILSSAIRNVEANMPGRLIPVAFHLDYGGYEDPMTLPVNTRFYDMVNTGEGLPMFALNFRKSSSHIINEYSKIVAEIEHQTETYPASAGVAVSSTYEDGSASVEVTARFKVKEQGGYRYHIFLVEDGIEAVQVGSDDGNYVHDNVFRAMAADNIMGAKLNGGADLVPGKEYSVTKTIPLEEGWNPENMRVVAVILRTDDEGGTVCADNANVCVFGESVDYYGNKISETGAEVVLSADRTEIRAGSGQTVRFSVSCDGADVTESALILCVNSPEGLQKPEVVDVEFTSDVAGVYEFVAWYRNNTSKQVSVTVSSAEDVEEGRFQRRVCVMEFTGTWCAQCPDGATILNYLISRTYKDKAYALAFHNDDEYSIPQEQELYNIFGWSGYPAFVTDMRDVGLMNEGGCGPSIEKSLYDSATHCGVRVSSVLDSETGKVSVSAHVFAERSAAYRVAAYVVEDKIKGEQTMSTGSVDKNYTHRHVVRKMLSSTVRGESLGRLSAGSEVEKSFEFTVGEGWNTANLSVAVLAIDEAGHVNNMAICAADGGTMDYEYVNN